MAYNLNAKIIMRNDTPQAWNSANPILQKGEVGCAIDEANGIVTFKVGDGIHHWRDLEMRPGKRESSTTYSTAKGDYATLANMPSKPSGCSYVEGAQSYATGHYSHVEGTSTSRRTNLENHMAEMTEAMKKLQYAASIMAVCQTGGNEIFHDADGSTCGTQGGNGNRDGFGAGEAEQRLQQEAELASNPGE